MPENDAITAKRFLNADTQNCTYNFFLLRSCAKETLHISNINKNLTLAITNWKFNMIVSEELFN